MKTQDIHDNGVLALGDAANMIEPTFGGGIPHAMISGKAAAGVIAEGVKNGSDFSKEYLNKYRQAIDKVLVPGYEALKLFRQQIFTDPNDLTEFINYKNNNPEIKAMRISGGALQAKFIKEVKGFKGEIGCVYGK